MSRIKKLSYVLIERNGPDGQIYELMRELIEAHHEHLLDARIALAWNRSWKPDNDNRVTLGMCRLAGELDRELAPFDFAIVLSEEFWTNKEVTDIKRRALLDHELCHAGIVVDKYGDPRIDERGRKLYRIVKHDLEEFAVIAGRYGCWKSDLERFSEALQHSPQPGLLGLEATKPLKLVAGGRS